MSINALEKNLLSKLARQEAAVKETQAELAELRALVDASSKKTPTR